MIRTIRTTSRTWAGAALSHPRRIALVGALMLGMSLATSHTAQAVLTPGTDVIPAPSSMANSSAAGGASNSRQQGFNERQGVVLTAPLAVDGGTIPAGTVVDSHMIFLNIPDGAPETADFGQVWTFASRILGVISGTNGANLAASDFLGAPGTFYPGAFANRGLETNNGTGIAGEGYAVSGNGITVGMRVTQPGDWIRVITQGQQYNICALFDQSKSHRQGSTVPIKLQLCDANGQNLSSAAIVVKATEPLTKLDGTPSSVEDSGSANSPDDNFRYDPTLGGTGGYIYNLSTTGLSSGTWRLSFTVNGAAHSGYAVSFDVK